MNGFFELTLGGFLGSGVAAALLGAFLLRRNVAIESDIKSHFDRAFREFESVRRWKEAALAELYGPVCIQFDRTRRAFARWDRRNLHLEACVVKAGNTAIRDLLLTKGHLIPPRLMEDAGKLIEHYDAWLEAFETIRNDPAKSQAVDFVFVGPQGYPFPVESEARFREEFSKLQAELYPPVPGQGAKRRAATDRR